MCVGTIVCVYLATIHPIIRAKTVIQVNQCLSAQAIQDLDFVAPKDDRYQWRCKVMEVPDGTGTLR